MDENIDKLEYYSFAWSEVRLVIAAVALLLSGAPPLFFLLVLFPGMVGLLNTVLTLCWIVSGLSAGYLLYKWVMHNMRVFGGQVPLDLGALGVLIVSGLNLGIAGISSTNIGMSISMNYALFVLVALLYLASSVYLFFRWGAHGKRLFF